MSAQKMKVWVHGQEVERLVDHFEEKLKTRFGGFEEVQTVPVPQLNPGERIEKRKHRILIIPS